MTILVILTAIGVFLYTVAGMMVYNRAIGQELDHFLDFLTWPKVFLKNKKVLRKHRIIEMENSYFRNTSGTNMSNANRYPRGI